MFSVSFLILLALGWRESLIVLLAIPATLALTLLVFYLYGFTLNRITLFALIFSIGILVDDAIVVVENIVRHFHLPESQGRSRAAVAIEAVSEVGNPTILATFAVIAAVLPMAFVGGLMGPYMRPIPIGASAAMFFSLAISFIVTPWAAVRILQWRRKIHSADSHAPDREAASENFFGRMYRGLMTPLIASAKRRYHFSRRARRAAARFDGAGRRRLGEGENAAVRQQERISDHPEHAGRQFARTHRAVRA